MLPPVALGDESAALFATWALLAALYWRDVRGGTGQVIDVSLFESLYSLLGPLPTLVRHLGHEPVRSGSRLSFSSPAQRLRDRDGCWIARVGHGTLAGDAAAARRSAGRSWPTIRAFPDDRRPAGER